MQSQDPYCPVELSCRKRKQVLSHSSLYYLCTKDMLWSFKTYIWGMHMFLGIKETGCSSEFSAHLTPYKSTELSQQKLLPVVFKVREIPMCCSLTWHTPKSFLPAEEKIFLCAKQATTVSQVCLCILGGCVVLIPIPMHLWICTLLSGLSYWLIRVAVKMFHFTVNINFSEDLITVDSPSHKQGWMGPDIMHWLHCLNTELK